MAIENRFPFFEWQQGPRQDGVTLRHVGEGQPLVIVPGMEGSGESTLHLIAPVIQSLLSESDYQLILLDYSGESHQTLESLVETSYELLTSYLAGQQALLWGQSYGNILAMMIAARGLNISRAVLVNPFTVMPAYTRFGTWLLSVTPGSLYRTIAVPFGRFMFGPPGDRPQHEFFDSLAVTPVADIVRRTRWCIGQDFSAYYSNCYAPLKVWLGAQDRLINFAQQSAFFSLMASTNEQHHFSIIKGCGHVAIPSSAATELQQEIGAWLSEGVESQVDGREADAA